MSFLGVKGLVALAVWGALRGGGLMRVSAGDGGLLYRDVVRKVCRQFGSGCAPGWWLTAP